MVISACRLNIHVCHPCMCGLHVSCKRTGFKLCRLLFHLSHGHALMTDRFLFHVCASHKKKGKQREGEGG